MNCFFSSFPYCVSVCNFDNLIIINVSELPCVETPNDIDMQGSLVLSKRRTKSSNFVVLVLDGKITFHGLLNDD